MRPQRSFQRSGLTLYSIISAFLIFGTGCSNSSLLTDTSTHIDSKIPPRWSTQLPTVLPVRTDEGPKVYGWVADFSSPELDVWVSHAISGNLDLKLAIARMEDFRQNARLARANRFPVATLRFDASQQHQNGRFFDDFGTDTYDLGFLISWEADVWGRFSDSEKATLALLEGSILDLEQLKHSIAARIANAWIDCVTAKLQLTLAEETAESFDIGAESIKNRYDAGVTSILDYRLALANFESSRAALEDRRRQMKLTIRNLQLLLGEFPSGDLAIAGDLPILPGLRELIIPADLVERRPDVLAELRRVEASRLSIGIAEKVKLPSMSLTTANGVTTNELKNVLDSNFDYWRAAIRVEQPIFTAGRIGAEADIARAQYEQSLILYQQVVLQAFFEVEQGLESELLLDQFLDSSEAAARESEAAETLAWEQYDAGLIDIITLLEAQRRALQAKQTVIDAKNARLKNRVFLYLALGGQF